MNTQSPQFDDDRRPPPSGSNNLMWILLAGFGVLAVMIVMCGFALLLPAVQQARMAARRASSKNNLKQIGLALHNYHEIHQVLPPSAIVDENGTPRQGWTYSILPYVDQSSVFEQIDDHAAWNATPNVPFSRARVEVYLNPAISEQENKDGYPLSHYAANSRLFEPNKSWEFREMTDGLSNTLMVGEINAGFTPWAMPPHTRDPAKGFNKGPDTFGSPFPGGVQFLMGDGAVRFISDDINPAVLKALATPNGEEQIPPGF